jgi:hypothetical protein
LAGRLDGSINGRPVSMVASGGDLILGVSGPGTLFQLRRGWPVVRPFLLTLARWLDVRLLVQVGPFGRREVFPSPGFFLRRLLPPN